MLTAFLSDGFALFFKSLVDTATDAAATTTSIPMRSVFGNSGTVGEAPGVVVLPEVLGGRPISTFSFLFTF
jgi:hypothetical protein